MTFISDTHGKHNHLTSKAYNNILGSGDCLIHAGDWGYGGKLRNKVDECIKKLNR